MISMDNHEEITYCEVHPDVETGLRCNKCNRLMCPDCAVHTSVGYRCKECIREHEDKFFSGTNRDYIVVFAISLALSAVGAFFIRFVSFGSFFGLILVLLLSAPIGGAIGHIALQLTGRRRGRYSAQVAVAGTVAGGLLSALVFSGAGIISLLYVAATTSAVYGRFQIRI